MKCEICGKEILRDSQCINYKYYHNDCIENIQEEMKKLTGVIQTYEILLKANTEENKKLKKVIDRASARLEYFLIGNLKYQSSQEEFIKLLDILTEVQE